MYASANFNLWKSQTRFSSSLLLEKNPLVVIWINFLFPNEIIFLQGNIALSSTTLNEYCDVILEKIQEKILPSREFLTSFILIKIVSNFWKNVII